MKTYAVNAKRDKSELSVFIYFLMPDDEYLLIKI